MAMQTLIFNAKSTGYGSYPMIGFDIEKVAELINLSEDHVMSPIVAIGKGTKDLWRKLGQLSLGEVVVENSF
jgi:nitroreductase